MNNDRKDGIPILFANLKAEANLDLDINKNETGIIVIDAANKLKEEIYNDHLTGFENRKGLNQFKNNLEPEEYPLLMLSIDLDNLKKVNDTYGHPAGDKYIYSFVKFINELFPDNKKFRLGGDEFFIPVSNLDSEKIKSFYDKLKIFNNDQENKNFDNNGKEIYYLQLTYGVDIAISDKDFYDALKRSDDKLIEAKSLKKSLGLDFFSAHKK